MMPGTSHPLLCCTAGRPTRDPRSHLSCIAA